MIHIFKSYSTPPVILLSDGCQQKIIKSIDEKNSHKFSYYYNHDDVKKALEEIYHEKCGYCESKSKHIASLQVEHYRPKAKVVEDSKHKGYYWLGYEWSNLLLACPKCNEQGAKGNKFPIEGIRIFRHSNQSLPHNSPLIDERPLLLNPEIDNPKEHFIFDEYGRIKSSTTRGIKTIEICKLDRDKLNIMRRAEIIDNIFAKIKPLIIGFQSNTSMPKETFIIILKSIFQDLENMKNPSNSYALLGWYMFNHFDKFVKVHINNTFQIPIIKAWSRYRKGKL